MNIEIWIGRIVWRSCHAVRDEEDHGAGAPTSWFLGSPSSGPAVSHRGPGRWQNTTIALCVHPSILSFVSFPANHLESPTVSTTQPRPYAPVNAVAPGFIETDMTHKLSQELKDNLVGHIALKRI
jgi:hypothetical protein